MPDPEKPDRITHNQKIKVTAVLVRLAADGTLATLTPQKAADQIGKEINASVTTRLVCTIGRTLGLTFKVRPTKTRNSRWAIKTLRDDLDKLLFSVEQMGKRVAVLEDLLSKNQ